LTVKRKSRRIAVAAVLAGATVLAACSSSKSSSSSSQTGAPTTAAGAATSTTAAAAAAFGTPKPATGTPLKVGFVTDGKTANIDNSSEVPAAQAAVKYVNQYLGGINGHPITLDICDTQQTPSGGTDCGNQMVSDGVPVVLESVSGQAPSVYKPIAAANIPYVGYSVADAGVLQAKTGAYVLTNGLSTSFAGPAKVAQLAGAKHAAEVVIDVPGATGPAKALDPAFYKNAGGITVDVVAIPPGTADMTPQMQAELTKNPDQVHIIGDVPFCTSAIKALKSLGYNKPVVVIQQCIASGSAASIPGGYKGVVEITSASFDPTAADTKLYVAAMSTWAAGTPPFVNGVTSEGYATVLGFAQAMSGLTSDPTPANIEAAFAAMSPQPLPFGGGINFQCDGKQVSLTASVCSTGALEATLDQSGNPVGAYTALDASAIEKLG
jgi:branched-chain amino acid transport system substrate-binding protein